MFEPLKVYCSCNFIYSHQLLEATTNFAASQSQHARELQQWKDQTTNMVDLQKYTKVQIDLVDSQRSFRDLHDSVTNREEMTAKKFKGKFR